ncbi:MAG: tetratricopeptide repeat protein [bacterium]|nr:tetratricopeptide repeat protein [bacterium]
MFEDFRQHDVASGLLKLIAQQYAMLPQQARRALQALAVYNVPVPAVAAQYVFADLDEEVLDSLTDDYFLAQYNAQTGQFEMHPLVQEYAYQQIPAAFPQSLPPEPVEKPSLEEQHEFPSSEGVGVGIPSEEGQGVGTKGTDLQEAPKPTPTPSQEGNLADLPPKDRPIPDVRADLHERAAKFYAELKKPKKEWQSLTDLQPHLHEIEQRISAGQYDRAARVLNQIDFRYLQLWGHSRIVIRLREQLRGRLKEEYLIRANSGNLGLTYWQTGRVKEASPLYEEALASARKEQDRQGEGAWLGNLGLAYADLGEPRRAIDSYTQALDIAREIGDRRGEGNRLGNLGLTYADLGEPRRAIDFYTQALDIAREIGDRRGEGSDLGKLGNAYLNLGEPRRAIDFYTQALDIVREIGDRRGEGIHLGNLGLAYLDLGEPRRAIDSYTQALDIAREIGDRRGEGNRLGNLGIVYANLGEPRRAIDYYTQALDIAREIGDRRGEGSRLGNLGLAYANLGEPHQAIDSYTQALDIAREIRDRRGEGSRLGNLGLAYANLGEPHQAIDSYTQALDIAREIGDRRGEGIDLGNLGEAYLDLCLREADDNMLLKAFDCHRQALEIQEEIEAPDLVCDTLNHLGFDSLLAAETEQAAEYFTRCLAACERTLAQARLYTVLYERANALLGLDIVGQPGGAAEAALREALDANAESGVVQQAIQNVERLRRICQRHSLPLPPSLESALTLLQSCAESLGINPQSQS